MKKIISLLLSFITLFTISISPVFATENQNEILFDLYSTVYNYGEAVDKIVLYTDDLTIDETSLSTDMFKVYATATTPYTDDNIINMIESDGLVHCGLYDNVERTVKQVSFVEGNIILDLYTTKDSAGQSTLDFTANFETLKGCNLSLDISYRIELIEPLKLLDGTSIRNTDVIFYQNGDVKNDEIAKFTSGEYDGLKYQLYTPDNANDGNNHPLIVWLHGGGESGYKGILYNNVSQLKANRGAVTFATDEAQEIFRGAYVLAPQVPDEWSEHLIDTKELIDKIIADYQLDSDRIYVYGCSAGGYMALDLAVHNPNFFAAVVATCPAIDQSNIDVYGEGRIITDEEIMTLKDTPIWLVQSKNDGTVKYEEAALRVYNLLKDVNKNAILTAYDVVQVGDEVYSGGHESWVYTALNMPEYNGEHLWQWTARQVLIADEAVIDTPNEIQPVDNNNASDMPATSVKTGDSVSYTLYLILLSISGCYLIHNSFKKIILKCNKTAN